MAELVDLSDIVYHLAAAVGVRLIMDSPVRTIETNMRCTEIVLSLAETKRKRVLITSSSEVYGKTEQVPFREDDDMVLGPDQQEPLELCLLQGDRRVSGHRLLERAESSHRDCPAI